MRRGCVREAREERREEMMNVMRVSSELRRNETFRCMHDVKKARGVIVDECRRQESYSSVGCSSSSLMLPTSLISSSASSSSPPASASAASLVA
jgi:hypothetical protein